ncbi:NYN domain-containing protein [Desulfoluna sp.]|uniref:NYN domain-containing protein n=1 Tax=Desulfoluna sp. TaxID=2045199 RepID=UPI00262DF1A0|nr:NYN domain-containing protein [Desulfoluna sp.]
MKLKNTALLIDFENLICGLSGNCNAESDEALFDPSLLLKLCEDQGKLTTALAYADWRHRDYNQHQFKLYQHGIELVHVLGKGQKNAVDLRLAVDAMEMIYERPQIDRYVIVSGDRDFIHLLKKLKLHNKEIVGVSPENCASEDLAELCDRFVNYESLQGIFDSELRKPNSGNLESLNVFKAQLRDLLERHVGEQGILGAQLKSLIRRHISTSFDESQYGYRKFIDLILALNDIATVQRTDSVGDFYITAARFENKAPRIEDTDDIISKLRAKLSVLNIDWDRSSRDGMLAFIHDNMVRTPTFSVNSIIEELEGMTFDDGRVVNSRKLDGYIKVCNHSSMLQIQHLGNGTFRDREIALKSEYHDIDAFISRFEYSLIYKVKEMLPNSSADALEICKKLLELQPEDDDKYLENILNRLPQKFV